MKHLILSLLLLLPLLAKAEIITVKIGTLYYNLDETTLTAEVTNEEGWGLASPIYYGDIVIPATVTHEGNTYDVTAIGLGAFWSSTGLTSVTIPHSVTTIGDHSFRKCSELTTLTIPGSVTTIGSSAFGSCTGLTTLHLNSGLKTIGMMAFEGCKTLTSVTIPHSVTDVGYGSFAV